MSPAGTCPCLPKFPACRGVDADLSTVALAKVESGRGGLPPLYALLPSNLVDR
jgi:hypothetical protein